VQCLAHRPTDDFAGVQVQDGGQIQPSFAGRCVFRGKPATDSGMKSATDSDLIAANPI
jgi:hypothetical protein